MGSSNSYDVIVVGAGHNGLVAGALLAKAGRRTCILEKRDVVGGAAISEQPWGPDFTVTALSYVVSLMPPTVVEGLELHRHGYKVYPQHGYFAPRRDGRYLQLPEDEGRRYDQIAKFSKRDAERYGEWDRWLGDLAEVLGPLLTTTPPRLGAKSPAQLWKQLRLAWQLRGLDATGVGDMTRLMTMSVSDLLDDVFESDALKGAMGVSGIIGTWAGPASPGTAFVMAHHKIGDVGEGQMGSWGFAEGGMGGVTRAMAKAARSFGCEIRTEAPVAKLRIREGCVRGAVLENGDEFVAPTVITTAHPAIAFLQHVEEGELPESFTSSIRRWKSRSGTVKINLALDRLPEFSCKPGFDPEVHGGTIILSESLEELERGFQEAALGGGSSLPFADICIPSVFDPTLAPEGKHVMSMFTQWVPHHWADSTPEEEMEAYVSRVIARVEELAPGFESSILHKQVIGPHEMQETYGLVGGNIFHGELSASQIFHMRPAPGYADYRTPIRGLYNASSATHGGGGVTGIPGLQVARILGAG